MPEKLGRYEIVSKLGAGNMGEVYKARDTVLGRIVALKKILAPDDAARQRFLREAKAAAALPKHPNVVMVLEYSMDGDTPYIVMEFVDGASLKERRPGSLNESLGILRETALALDHAHAHGVIHRDVKPANVMIAKSGVAMLADFGVARISSERTITVGSVGTPEYMPPEVWKGEKAAPQSDQFSLAVVAYYLLTGKRPFDGDGVYQLFYAITSTDPPAPSSVNPALPKALDAVILKALNKNPADRYESCAKFVAALREAIYPEPTTAPGIVVTPARGEPRPLEVRRSRRGGLEYVWIPPGSFTMGAADGEYDDERPPHPVTITKGFWLGRTPVTVAAWKLYVKDAGAKMPEAPRFNPRWEREGQPMVNVDWAEAAAYCEWLNGRLPSEAEWEYAARGGCQEARYENSIRLRGTVGQLEANAFELHDVLGNVWEWVADWYAADYYKQSPEQDPKGPDRGETRVLRGGSWGNNSRDVRLSVRFYLEPTYRNYGIGFRCAGELSLVF